MNVNSKNSSNPRRSRGATLVEVLGGLALLSALLVAILVAQAGYTRQSATADRRLRAAAAADDLLKSWWREPERFPVSSAGPVSSDERLAWRTRLIPATGLQNFEAQIVRLDIIDPSSASREQTPLVSLDIVVPLQVRPQ